MTVVRSVRRSSGLPPDVHATLPSPADTYRPSSRPRMHSLRGYGDPSAHTIASVTADSLDNDWPNQHLYRVNNRERSLDTAPTDLRELQALRAEIEPWLTSLVSSEHLALLVGSGLSLAASGMLGVSGVDMTQTSFKSKYAGQVDARAVAVAISAFRNHPNVEDQIRAVLELVAGLRIIGDDETVAEWQAELSELLSSFATRILEMENALKVAKESDSETGRRTMDVLASFFGSFIARAATKDRLHIFTTNYDRLVEYVLDESATWQIDRFVGTVAPQFRASRLDLDVHYSPPGIRGEPRYLEGVARLTKLHGSIDWVSRFSTVTRLLVPFGCDAEIYEALIGPDRSLLIYPNPAKDVETSEYPYAELFRDFSAAIVRPETVLVTYGYGFGDDHINRVIADMLTIPSTHLLAIVYGDPDLRLRRFLERTGRLSRVSLLMGPHFGDLENLVQWYLPKPSLDRVTQRETELLQRRGLLPMPPEHVEERASPAGQGDGDDNES